MSESGERSRLGMIRAGATFKVLARCIYAPAAFYDGHRASTHAIGTYVGCK